MARGLNLEERCMEKINRLLKKQGLHGEGIFAVTVEGEKILKFSASKGGSNEPKAYGVELLREKNKYKDLYEDIQNVLHYLNMPTGIRPSYLSKLRKDADSVCAYV